MSAHPLTTGCQRALLWAEAHGGRLPDGLHHATLYALCNRKLAAWHQPLGYRLTERGRNVAREIIKEQSL